MSCNINPILLMMLLSLSIYCSFSNKLCNEFILVYDSLRGLSILPNDSTIFSIELMKFSKLFPVASNIGLYLFINSANEYCTVNSFPAIFNDASPYFLLPLNNNDNISAISLMIDVRGLIICFKSLETFEIAFDASFSVNPLTSSIIDDIDEMIVSNVDEVFSIFLEPSSLAKYDTLSLFIIIYIASARVEATLLILILAVIRSKSVIGSLYCTFPSLLVPIGNLIVA